MHPYIEMTRHGMEWHSNMYIRADCCYLMIAYLCIFFANKYEYESKLILAFSFFSVPQAQANYIIILVSFYRLSLFFFFVFIFRVIFKAHMGTRYIKSKSISDYRNTKNCFSFIVSIVYMVYGCHFQSIPLTLA